MAKNETKVIEDNKKTKDFSKFREALKEVSKKYGNKDDDEVLVAPISELGQVEVKRFSTGSLILDGLIGGGFPEGRIIEIYGPESSGKTSIALNAIADVQRRGGNAVFIDAEQALDTHYASVLGVDVPNMGLAQSSVAETVLNTCRALAVSGTVDLIVVDSVASLSPKSESEGDDIGKQSMAELARILSKALRVLVGDCRKNNCTIIFLNQIREKVGVMFGNPETTPGGKALKFYASQRIEIRRKEQVKEGKEVIGTMVRMKVVKNKVGAPFKEGFTILTFAEGINRPAEMLEAGTEMGVIEKRGNTSYYRLPEGVEVNLVGDIASYDEKEREVKIGGKKSDSIESLKVETELYEVIAKEMDEMITSSINGVGKHYE